MANSGPDTNNSQFYLTVGNKTQEQLDGLHVVFGQVISGIAVAKAVETTGNKWGRSMVKCTIAGCGELKPASDTSQVSEGDKKND